MLTVKKGVSLRKVAPQMVLAAVVVDGIYTRFGVEECCITSGDDGQHGANSLHPEGKALDFRTRTIPESYRHGVRACTDAALGGDYDVVLESDHMHVEYDPK